MNLQIVAKTIKVCGRLGQKIIHEIKYPKHFSLRKWNNNYSEK